MTQTEWRSPLLKRAAVLAKLSHPVWDEIADYFKPSEFNNPEAMDVQFLRLLYEIRKTAGVPIRITSDARDPQGNVGAVMSAHKKRPCRAIDCKVASSHERACLVIAAIRCGIVRLGVYPGGDGDAGVIHIDAESAESNPSPRIWTKY